MCKLNSDLEIIMHIKKRKETINIVDYDPSRTERKILPSKKKRHK